MDEPDGAAAGTSELVEWAKQQLGRQLDHTAAPLIADMQQAGSSSTPAFDENENRPAREDSEFSVPLQLHRIDVAPFKPFDIGRASSPPVAAEPPANRPHNMAREFSTAGPRNALQVHNRYLVVETDTGIEVIDQHALHERILYEHIREKVLGGVLESQKLLVPEPVDLAASEAAAVLEHADLLAQLGVEIQPFGGETVLVSSYPAMLANLSPAEVLRELVEKLLSGGRRPEPRDLLDDLLHMIACKAAVKFGDRLSGEEIEALLAQRHLARDDHHCPHGRPTALVFTREDLDRQFKRI